MKTLNDETKKAIVIEAVADITNSINALEWVLEAADSQGYTDLTASDEQELRLEVERQLTAIGLPYMERVSGTGKLRITALAIKSRGE